MKDKTKAFLGLALFIIINITSKIYPLKSFHGNYWWLALIIFITIMVWSMSIVFMYLFKTLHKDDYDRFKKYK